MVLAAKLNMVGQWHFCFPFKPMLLQLSDATVVPSFSLYVNSDLGLRCQETSYILRGANDSKMG